MLQIVRRVGGGGVKQLAHKAAPTRTLIASETTTTSRQVSRQIRRALKTRNCAFNFLANANIGARLFTTTSNNGASEKPENQHLEEQEPTRATASSSMASDSSITSTSTYRRLTLGERWRANRERFRQKKAQFLLEYGTTFIFLHEMLGIASYLTVFSVLYTGVIPTESILNFFGWTEADLMARGINLHGFFTTWALTVVVVKGLDVLGLVPLRWFLSITLTPRIAWYMGPKLDRLVAWVKSFRGGKSPASPTTPPPSPPSTQ